MDFDVLTKLPAWNNHKIRVEENPTQIKRTLLKTVTRQQQVLRTMINKIKAEKAAVDESLLLLRDYLIIQPNTKLIKKYNRYLDEIDPLVNLIFGLEMKIANLSKSSNSAIHLKRRLKEAIMIKDTHDKTLNLILNHLDASNQSQL